MAGYSLSKRSWLGVGVESTPGTALVAPTVYHPAKSIMKGTKKREQLKEERGNRDGVYGIVDTIREGAIDPKGPFYADTSPYFMLGAWGAVTSTQPDATNLPNVHKHTFALADQPKTLTLFKNYDAAVYVGAYAVVEKWTLKFAADGKVLENDVALKHLYPVKYAGAQLTPTFSPVQPFAGYAPQITLGGVSTLDIDDVMIEFDQKCTLWYPAGGSADFAAVYFGERTVKVDFTARFDTDALYNHFFNGSRTDDSFTIDVKGPSLGVDGANTYYQELNISVPIISYDSMDHDLSKDNVLIKAKATAISTANQTGGSPMISAFVQNLVASYTV
ncbi:phage tail tube protein [Ktedonobacter robiniae]|uniref:Phage tail protein n=1 Tax=Ktedonobacter robiniae TaxID=2778365 RepID=A0ABQ3US20_9CHLR|nr:phage tail tube protein [Ktedonobacter robiniae]GHO55526.1 hypothetical protein KSB_40010 [Ktedonobacter robiniae]